MREEGDGCPMKGPPMDDDFLALFSHRNKSDELEGRII